MAIDASILLQGGTVPDLMGALHRGAQAGDMMSQMMEARRNRPLMRERARLENELLQSQVARQQQMNQLGVGAQVGARKIFNDGTIIQSTPLGPRVFAPGGTTALTGDAARQALEGAFQNESVLAGSKARAGAEGRLSKELEIEPQITAAKQKELDKQKILSDTIDKSLDAIGGISDIGRSLELLDLVNTGKPEQALLSAQKFFGIESADAGELQALLGQAVVADLKASFGGNPTEGEREALKDVSAAFSQEGGVNKRLLNRGLTKVERTIKRGLRAAERKEDEFSAEEFERALNQIIDIKERVPAALKKVEPEKTNDFDLEFDPATGTFK